MNLSEKISNIIASRSQELYFLLKFVRDFDAYIYRLGHKFIYNKVPNEIRDEFMQLSGEFGKFLQEFINETKGITPIKGEVRREFKTLKNYSEETERYLFPYLKVAHKFVKYRGFLYNMVVTHSITIFEAFLSDLLGAIFTLKLNRLKSENIATYEEILSFSSMKELINYLSSKRTRKILEGDLRKDVADELNKIFSIDISKFDKFNVIHEAFCRRHIIVHNDGKTDKKYCEKIPNSKTGEYLSTDLRYIETLLTTIGQFIDYLDGRFSRKMRYRRNPAVNQLLNPPKSKGDGD